MKRLTEVPEEVLNIIEREQNNISSKMFRKYHVLCVLPVRPVRMLVYRNSNKTAEMEQVIVPATTIYIRQDGYIGKKLLDRDAITYSVANCTVPFPYGHIYKGSGHVCLGDIFVPSAISRFNPQQPLETLFLHNDRNLNHGNACLTLSGQQVQRVKDLLLTHNITLSVDADASLQATHNMLEDDGIWLIGSDVYQKADGLETALSLMRNIYDCIFETDNKKSKKE